MAQVGATVQQRNRHIARSTLLVMVIFAVTKGISLLQTFIIARFFGVGREYDAYVAALRVPELLVVLISGGALTHAFIPLFSGYLARDDREGAWRLASHVVNTVFTVAVAVSALVFVLTPALVPTVIAPGFDAQTAAQTVELMRILLLGTIIFAVSALLSGILQSHQHFLSPALAPIMYDLGILFGVVVLLQPLGLRGVAIGTVLGAGMHLLIQVPALLHYKARWVAELGWRDPQLWQVVRLMLPRIVGLGVFQFNFLVMNNIASRLGVGAVSAFDWGWRLMQIPQTLIGTAMGIVIFPTLAGLSALGDEQGKRSAMTGALRFILIASIPSAVGLWVVGRPLISLLEGGAFDASASLLVYGTLRAFMLGLIVHSMLEVVARSFYADKDTLTPLWAALIGALVNVVLSFVLSNVASADANRVFLLAFAAPASLGSAPLLGNVSGLALANSLATLVEVGVLLVILRRRWSGIEEGTLAATLLKTTVASLIMAGAVITIEALWGVLGWDGRGTLFTVGMIGMQVLFGGATFFVSALLLGMQEVLDIVRLLLNRSAKLQEAT